MGQLNVKLSYPNSEEFEYVTKMVRLALDDERINDLLNNNGFIIKSAQGIKKDLKSDEGIYSSNYGRTLKDINPFGDRYRCKCGRTTQRINNGITCQWCGYKVEYVDDNYEYFGWCVLNDYYVIHPNLYKSIQSIIGKDLADIIQYHRDIDINGNEKSFEETVKPDGNPWYKIGMTGFKNNFKEILDFYIAKKPKKMDYYDDIMNNIDKVFTQSIPVYTTLLRPYDEDGDSFFHEKANTYYSMINKLVQNINESKGTLHDREKLIESYLYDIQFKYNELYKHLEDILSGKKGVVRSLFGGRYNFTARSVIAADPMLGIDEIKLSYKCLVELLQQSIISILQKSYNMSYNDAYGFWYKAQIKKNDIVVKIINSLIDNHKKKGSKGIPCIINRNPTINYGSIMAMYCVGMVDSYTMSVPLRILPPLAADFDGDTLNILYMINQSFEQRAMQIFNPRNAMQISRNDGNFNNDVNHQRDTLIVSNTFIDLGRKSYAPGEIDKIKSIKEHWSNVVEL